MVENNLVKEFVSLVAVEDFEQRYAKDIYEDKFFGMPLAPIVSCEKKLREKQSQSVAYFSMEYGLATSFYNCFQSSQPIDPKNYNEEQEVFSNYPLADYFFTFKLNTLIDLPIYSGGLGVLAGDTIKTMADYAMPAVAVGVLWNSGYFRQRFWYKHGQLPAKTYWEPASYPGLVPLKNKIKLLLRNQQLWLRIWKYYVYSYRGDYCLPLILLDANIPENSERDRRLTDQLYRSDDARIKIMQRVILGMGGVMALKEMGYSVSRYHMNEGHAVFSFIEAARGLSQQQIEALTNQFVYTCHTPVEAGHDRFHSEELKAVLLDEDFSLCERYGLEKPAVINLTLLAMNVSSSVNAVSKKHGEVMHLQFPQYKDKIKYITNGVHSHTWMSPAFQQLLNKYKDVLGDFQTNPMGLEQIKHLAANVEFRQQLWQAHQENKRYLCQLLSKWKFDVNVFTICWARRFAAYKRPSLLMQDVRRLVAISKKIGPLQIIIAGKAHPKDRAGFSFINHMMDKIDGLTENYDTLKIVMPENYEIGLARILTSSVDLWLNNPLPPFEASGTSGMKAVLNGVVQLSTLDGWMVEAQDKNIGKTFGYTNPPGSIGDERELHMSDDAKQLYIALEEMAQMYYAANLGGQVNYNSQWLDLMINCLIAAGYFNTYRMLDQYKQQIYRIL
ncbi:MAG: alpha-glucan family phosphorylase [Candidatus Omnitrophica bacterium]|nr:alpha-glucan family phosphorylase [Candidatus Omnitrophota bacterium]